VVVPIVDAAKKYIQLSELHDVGSLAPGAFGIDEPVKVLWEPVDASEIELALVPGVVFDRQGGRVGFGGGYFDKLLASMPHARRIALAYSLQLLKQNLPLHDHDIPMQLIITEKEVIQVP
jgi:5-formyltetrahydrofolate cyclo-ligase